MALVWFGRGDSIETDFAQHVAEATCNSNETDVNYMAKKFRPCLFISGAGLDRLKSKRPGSKWNIDDVA